MEDIYGATGRDPAVVGAFDVALRDLWARGTAAVLADFIAA
jgi:mannitol 2-dehydrogenase